MNKSSLQKTNVKCYLFCICLGCGTAKKSKATKDQVLWPGAKKHLTIKITDGTPFSSAHAYKVEEEGSCLQCGTAKKPKAIRTKSLNLELKAPHTYYYLM